MDSAAKTSAEVLGVGCGSRGEGSEGRSLRPCENQVTVDLLMGAMCRMRMMWALEEDDEWSAGAGEQVEAVGMQRKTEKVG